MAKLKISKTRLIQAIRGSTKKWDNIVDTINTHCSLCGLFFNDMCKCKGCPLADTDECCSEFRLALDSARDVAFRLEQELEKAKKRRSK